MKSRLRSKALLHILGFGRYLLDRNIVVYAASTAFFLFLAFPPLIIVLSLLLPYLGIRIDEVIALATEITPDSIDVRVAWIIRDTFTRSGRILPWTIIVVLWAVTSGMTALADGLNMVYSVEKKKGFLVLRLLSLAYLFALVVLLVLYTVLSALGDRIEGWEVWMKIRHPEYLQLLVDWRALLFFGVGFVMVLLLYIFLSGKKLRVKYHLAGTAFTIGAWLVFSLIFSLYLQMSTNRNLIYGSLSAFVAILLWIYIAVAILLVGGALNEYIHRCRAESANTG